MPHGSFSPVASVVAGSHRPRPAPMSALPISAWRLLGAASSTGSLLVAGLGTWLMRMVLRLVT